MAHEVEHRDPLAASRCCARLRPVAQQPDLAEHVLQGGAIHHPNRPNRATARTTAGGWGRARSTARAARAGNVSSARRPATRPASSAAVGSAPAGSPAGAAPQQVIARQQAGQRPHRRHLPPDQRDQQRHHHRQRQDPPAQPIPPILLRHRVSRRPDHLGEPRIHLLTRWPRRRTRTHMIPIPRRWAAMRPRRQLAHPVVFAHSPPT